MDFAATKRMFHLPEGVTYLDGNSLGPLPVAATAQMADVMQNEWGAQLIRAWNTAGWMERGRATADRIGRLIGASSGSVMMGDTLSVKVFQAVSAALGLVPERRKILSDIGNFPSDLYIARGLAEALGKGHELVVVPPQEVMAAITDEIGVVLLTEVDYRTGRRHDMQAVSHRAHDAGAVIVWDLAHSAGAFPVDLAGCHADFAVGCTYKYLNGGPGSPGFIYAARQHHARINPIMAGWLGHDAPFAFDADYRPANGIGRMRVGTPPVLALAALDAALDVFDNVDMAEIRKQSESLMEQFIEGVEAACPALELASPRQTALRGSQVSFRFQNGYAAMQALIAEGVIGDFRAPDIMRFGFTPLYVDAQDVTRAVATIERVINGGLWDRPEFHQKGVVT